MTCASEQAKKHIKEILPEPQTVSGVTALAKPRRIKASHRRRRKVASDHLLYILNNPLSGTDPTGYAGDCPPRVQICSLGTNTLNKLQSMGADFSTVNGETEVHKSINAIQSAQHMPRNAGRVTVGAIEQNGAAEGQTTHGSENRKGEKSQAAEIGSVKKSIESGGNNHNSMSLMLNVSGDGVYYTSQEPSGLTALKRKYPQIDEKMNETWEKSDGWWYNKEHSFHAWISPNGQKIAFVEAVGEWVEEAGAYARVNVPPREYEVLARRAGIDTKTWRMVVAFHTHPFFVCYSSALCGPNSFRFANLNAVIGPSGSDGKDADNYPNAYHVVREVPNRVGNMSGDTVDFYYGNKVFPK